MSLQDLIDRATSPLDLIRTNDFDLRYGFPYPLEHSNWRDEQRAWRTTAVLFHQSFHMEDLFITGPDVVKLLSDTSVTSFKNFRPGIAKQYVAVNDEGQLFGDAILVALSEREVNATGREWALNWLKFRAEKGGYDVRIESEPASHGEPGSKRLYRYEIVGPNAQRILNAATGEELPRIRFFHTGMLKIAGKEVWALNHTMGGVPGQEHSGFELFGPAGDENEVIAAIVAAGQQFGLVRGGARAYLSAGIESGWMGATTIPAIYTSESLREYREWLPERTMEAASVGVAAGSFAPETVEGYYSTPWDHGYGHIVKFDHDFIGRTALEKMQQNPPRQKVWLRWNEEDTDRIVRASELDRPNAPKLLPFPSGVGREQVLVGDRLVGLTTFHGYTVNLGGWASLASIETATAVDGAEVEILWGDRDGGASNPAVPTHAQTRIRARVHVNSPVA